jgi:hypothetical protein
MAFAVSSTMAAPVVDPEPADLDPPLETKRAVPPRGQTNLVTTTFTATDLETPPGNLTFSNAVLSSYVLLRPEVVPPAFNGSVAANGDFTWNTTGFPLGTYEIDVTVTNSAGLFSSGGNYIVTIDMPFPEPSSITLCALALLGVGFRRRR